MDEKTATFILVVCFATAGILALTVAISDADWFFKSPGVKGLTGRLNRRFSRIIYALVGLAILAVTVLLVLRALTLP